MTALHLRLLGPWFVGLPLLSCAGSSSDGATDTSGSTPSSTNATTSGATGDLTSASAATGGGGSASTDTSSTAATGSTSGASNAQSASSDGTTAGGSSSDGTTSGETTTGGSGSDGASSDGTTTAGGTATSGSSSTTGGVVRPDYDTLREAAAAADRLIGAAVDANALNGGDARYSDTLAREFDYVTPENATKWGPLAPSSTSYDWQDADAILGFAEDNQQFVKGHTFVWHLQTPGWVSSSMSESDLRAALKSHIETTLARYQGRIRAWDVVNEAVDVSTASGYRESVFYQTLGEGYIADAFRWARAADPDVLLFYNEIGIERLGAKSDFTYAMLSDLLDSGVPIDGIGLQSHVSIHRYPSEADLRANIRRFADLGLIVNISEVDARTNDMPGSQTERWLAERIAFQQVVGSCALEAGCEAVTFWGITDNYSWINDEGADDPLLFDRNYSEKPAYEGAMDGFAGLLPVRGANFIDNPDFESGEDRWQATTGELDVGAAQGRDGNAACVSGRTSVSDGILQNELLSALGSGGPMAFSARVRVDSAATVEAALLIVEGGSEREFNIASRAIGANDWFELSGYLGLGFEQTPSAIALKLYGPPNGAELCATAVQLQPLSIE